MQHIINTTRNTRQFVLDITEPLTLDELNYIPTGFNNNIAWNMGHLVAALQGVCYLRSGLPLLIDDNFYAQYKPGSKPGHFINETEIASIKTLLVTTLDQMEIDYKNGKFKAYEGFQTRYGVSINNIDEAINFLPYHEGLHTGYIMALKRTLPVSKAMQ